MTHIAQSGVGAYNDLLLKVNSLTNVILVGIVPLTLIIGIAAAEPTDEQLEGSAR